MSDEETRTLLREFRTALFAFGAEVEQDATIVLRETAETTAEAIVIGNEFGPGVPLDTGFLRAGFRVGINQPVAGPTTRPYIRKSLHQDGEELFTDTIDTAPVLSAVLGDDVYITTNVEYAGYLEELDYTRRHGPAENIGASTEFLEPVAARFDRIVDDAVARTGFAR